VFKKNKFLLISVFIHLIVMYVVAQSVMFPSVPDSPAKKLDVIQATLIFDLPPLAPEIPVEVMKEEAPTPVEEEIPVDETPEESQIKPILEPEVQATPIPPQPQAPTPKSKDEVKEKPEKNDEVSEITPSEQLITPTPSSEIRSRATNMARRHLNSFQQQQQNRIAEQASRYYQQHKNSPVINNEVKNPFMSEDEKFRDTLKVRADCSSTSQKTAAVLLGFLGGQVDCSKPPPIDGFIKNRINKESLIPGQYPQEYQKAGQSVVIKKQP
jgi:hypothetical protein